MNDWLLHEFRERVSKKRKLLLTDRLSMALKLASITVTEQEEETENELLKQRQVITVSGPLSLNQSFMQGYRNVVATTRAFGPSTVFVPAGEVNYELVASPQLNFIPAGQIVANYDLEAEKATAPESLKPAKDKDKE
jgi:hypothetical protein